MNVNNDSEKDYYSTQKKFWSVFARFYDFFIWPAARLRYRVVEFADAPHEAKILDVCTGTGKQAFAFAKRGYEVVGLDLSEAMLNVAKKKNRYDNLRFEIADASNMPFDDYVFDVSCVSFALHEMPVSIREKVLKEMVRVTKPGGMILTVDFDLPKNRITRFFIYNFLKLFEGAHYVRYIKTSLKLSITKAGIVITGEIPVLLGGARIIKGSTPP